eukprot:scaffold34404_cov30-Prasinocladus_malaysianus.AAC.1
MLTDKLTALLVSLAGLLEADGSDAANAEAESCARRCLALSPQEAEVAARAEAVLGRAEERRRQAEDDEDVKGSAKKPNTRRSRATSGKRRSIDSAPQLANKASRPWKTSKGKAAAAGVDKRSTRAARDATAQPSSMSDDDEEGKLTLAWVKREPAGSPATPTKWSDESEPFKPIDRASPPLKKPKSERNDRFGKEKSVPFEEPKSELDDAWGEIKSISSNDSPVGMAISGALSQYQTRPSMIPRGPSADVGASHQQSPKRPNRLAGGSGPSARKADMESQSRAPGLLSTAKPLGPNVKPNKVSLADRVAQLLQGEELPSICRTKKQKVGAECGTVPAPAHATQSAGTQVGRQDSGVRPSSQSNAQPSGTDNNDDRGETGTGMSVASAARAGGVRQRHAKQDKPKPQRPKTLAGLLGSLLDDDDDEDD